MRPRHDGFTPAKRRIFFAAVSKTGCVIDGCRVAGISRNTVSRWRKKEPGFEAELQRCLKVAAGEIERLAWDRAVNGAEEKVIRNGEVVQIKVKPSDSMLRLLLQASNPRKYGRMSRGGETRRQIEKRLRKEILREERARVARNRPSAEELRASILNKYAAKRRHRIEQENYTVGPEGCLVPPGWKMVRIDGSEDGPPDEESSTEPQEC